MGMITGPATVNFIAEWGIYAHCSNLNTAPTRTAVSYVSLEYFKNLWHRNVFKIVSCHNQGHILVIFCATLCKTFNGTVFCSLVSKCLKSLLLVSFCSNLKWVSVIFRYIVSWVSMYRHNISEIFHVMFELFFKQSNIFILIASLAYVMV